MARDARPDRDADIHLPRPRGGAGLCEAGRGPGQLRPQSHRRDPRVEQQCHLGGDRLEVRGPIGPLVAALGGLPVHDLVVDPFKLEDYIASFYGGDAR